MLTGLLVWAAAAALGLSALLQASRAGHDVLRYAGAVYLVWPGVNSWRSHRKVAPAADEPGGPPGSLWLG